jgi:hypothetical protein
MVGFAWQVRNRPEWELRFQQLLEFKEKHGDCKVPQHYKENKALGKWTAKQREQYKLMKKGKHSFLTPYRLERLNTIGFVWQVRSTLDDEELDETEKEVKEEGSKATAATTDDAGAQQLKDPPLVKEETAQTADELVGEAAAVATQAAAAAVAALAGEPHQDDVTATATV